MTNRRNTQVVPEGLPGKSPSESVEQRRVRKGPDPTLSKMSAAIAKNRDKFSVERISKAFARFRNTKID